MLTILMGRAKTGKSEQVLRRIGELGDSSRQILLVPEHASHQAEVDLCRACGDTASRHAEVLSFRRLCDRVLTITGGAAQVTLDAGGKLLTLQKALGEVAPLLKVYRRPSQKASFLQQLLDLFDELRCYDVSPELLESQAREIQGATRDKLLDLSLLYGAYESRLYRPGLDARDRMTKLCEALESSRYAFGKDVFVDGFTYFNAQERQVLESILRQARSVTVTLLGEPDSAEEMFQVSLRTRDQLTRLADQAGCPWEVRTLTSADDSALGYLEHHFFGEGEPYQGDSSAIRVREADTAFSEVEQTAADIRRLVAAGKCRYRDITVAARNMTDYEGTIETVFERYSIPAYLSRRSSMLEKPVWSLITGVLSALENGLEYEDMFRWLKTGLAGLMPEECDELENYVLTWEIHGKMWLRDVDWTDNPDGYGAPWDKRRQARLDRVNELRRRVRAPLAELYEGLKGGVTAGEKVNSLYSFLEHLNLQNALEEQMRAQAEAGRLQDAEETAQLWEILCAILDQFVEILGDEPMGTDEFSRLLRQILDKNITGAIQTVETLVIEGRELGQFVTDFTWYLRNLMLVQSSDDMEDVLDISSENLALLKEEASMVNADILMRYIRIFSELGSQIKYASQKRILIEIAIIKLCKPEMEKDYTSLVDRIDSLEKKLEKGVVMAAPGSARQGVGGSAQGAQGGSLPKAELPKAIPEDVKQVLTNWGGILSQLTGVTKTYLKMATRSLGPNGELMLVFDDKNAYEYVEQNRSDCQDALKAAAADRIGKEVAILVKLNDTGHASDEVYPDLGALIQMDIEEEDF
mgnify:CR=1 FL=1